MLRFMLGLVITTSLSAAPLCLAGASLASYEALGPAGCVVDPAIPLMAGGFSYGVLAASNPGVVTPDTAIFVTPMSSGGGVYGVQFTSSSFAVSGANFVDYLIGFTWDPPNIRSADDILSDPVVPPGLASVTTNLCLGSAFSGTTCPTSTATLTVYDNGITPVLFAATSFPPVSVLGVSNTLQLTGGGTGSASINGFTNQIQNTPEPYAWLIAGMGLAAVALRRLKRAQA